MDIKVDYIKLNDISDNVINNYDKLIDEFKDLLKIVDDIKTSWNGPDYDTFHDRLNEYINSIIPITEEIKFLGDNMKKAANCYESKDTKWKKELDSLEKDEYKYEK